MLSPWIAVRLNEAGHDAIHVSDCKLSGASDEKILEYAGREERVVITADTDFSNLLSLRRLERPGLFLLRDLPRSREDVLDILLRIMIPAAQVIGAECSIITLKRNQVRVRLLPLHRPSKG